MFTKFIANKKNALAVNNVMNGAMYVAGFFAFRGVGRRNGLKTYGEYYQAANKGCVDFIRNRKTVDRTIMLEGVAAYAGLCAINYIGVKVLEAVHKHAMRVQQEAEENNG